MLTKWCNFQDFETGAGDASLLLLSIPALEWCSNVEVKDGRLVAMVGF